MQNKRLWFGTAALIAMVIIGLAALSPWGAGRSQDEVWRRIQETGVLTVATDASFLPFEALDNNGELFGFDIDLAQEIGRRLGARVEYENIAYDGLLGVLVVKRDDVVISAFVPQPEREKDVSYTRPYFNAGTMVVSLAGDELFVKGDGRQGEWARDRRIAVEYGSNSDVLAREWTRLFPDVRLERFPTATLAMQAVETQKADAAVVDAISAFDFLQGHRALRIAGEPLEDEYYVMAVNVRSRKLLAALNEAIGTMEVDGTLPALRATWFGDAAR